MNKININNYADTKNIQFYDYYIKMYYCINFTKENEKKTTEKQTEISFKLNI